MSKLNSIDAHNMNPYNYLRVFTDNLDKSGDYHSLNLAAPSSKPSVAPSNQKRRNRREDSEFVKRAVGVMRGSLHVLPEAIEELRGLLRYL